MIAAPAATAAGTLAMPTAEETLENPSFSMTDWMPLPTGPSRLRTPSRFDDCDPACLKPEMNFETSDVTSTWIFLLAIPDVLSAPAAPVNELPDRLALLDVGQVLLWMSWPRRRPGADGVCRQEYAQDQAIEDVPRPGTRAKGAAAAHAA